ncbi:hypothetical protein Pcaca04_22730 [Pectobacterium carotovorum subsp. carotovorum]|nr:hypothetical protein Pcaca04_22730 [Pectobacterium carotovorum subsp. carotovorum]
MCVLEIVNKNDWMHDTNETLYRGGCSVGRFVISDEFILNYMSVIYNINVEDEDAKIVSDMSDINGRKVLYMQMSDILNKTILKEIRAMIKSPPEDILIIRKGNKLLSIEYLKTSKNYY